MTNIAHAVMQAVQPTGEICQFGYWIMGGTDLASYQTFHEQFQTTLAADDDWLALYPAATTFNEGKVYLRLLADGSLLDIGMAGPAYAGSDIEGPLPPQVREVLTMRTAVLTSDGRGRMYLPTLAHDNLTTEGLMPDSTRDQIVSSVGDAFTAAHAAAVQAAVYSPKLHAVNAVTSVDCGNVYDTQRRGRDKLVESRTSQAV